MKKLFPITLFALLALTACNNSSTTTTTPTDSTAVADTTVKPADSTVVADTTQPATDSSAMANTNSGTDNTGTDASDQKMMPNERIVPITRFTVAFISIGSGIDHAAKKQFDALVTKFEKDNKVKLPSETIGWGREGETDVCFDLSHVKVLQRAAFVSQVKATFNGNKLVQCKENTPCRVKK
jgi:hypothetical protein